MCKIKKGVQQYPPTQEEQESHTFQRYIVLAATLLVLTGNIKGRFSEEHLGDKRVTYQGSKEVLRPPATLPSAFGKGKKPLRGTSDGRKLRCAHRSQVREGKLKLKLKREQEGMRTSSQRPTSGLKRAEAVIWASQAQCSWAGTLRPLPGLVRSKAPAGALAFRVKARKANPSVGQALRAPQSTSFGKGQLRLRKAPRSFSPEAPKAFASPRAGNFARLKLKASRRRFPPVLRTGIKHLPRRASRKALGAPYPGLPYRRASRGVSGPSEARLQPQGGASGASASLGCLASAPPKLGLPKGIVPPGSPRPKESTSWGLCFSFMCFYAGRKHTFRCAAFRSGMKKQGRRAPSIPMEQGTLIGGKYNKPTFFLAFGPLLYTTMCHHRWPTPNCDRLSNMSNPSQLSSVFFPTARMVYNRRRCLWFVAFRSRTACYNIRKTRSSTTSAEGAWKRYKPYGLAVGLEPSGLRFAKPRSGTRFCISSTLKSVGFIKGTPGIALKNAPYGEGCRNAPQAPSAHHGYSSVPQTYPPENERRGKGQLITAGYKITGGPLANKHGMASKRKPSFAFNNVAFLLFFRKSYTQEAPSAQGAGLWGRRIRATFRPLPPFVKAEKTLRRSRCFRAWQLRSRPPNKRISDIATGREGLNPEGKQASAPQKVNQSFWSPFIRASRAYERSSFLRPTAVLIGLRQRPTAGWPFKGCGKGQSQGQVGLGSWKFTTSRILNLLRLKIRCAPSLHLMSLLFSCPIPLDWYRRLVSDGARPLRGRRRTCGYGVLPQGFHPPRASDVLTLTPEARSPYGHVGTFAQVLPGHFKRPGPTPTERAKLKALSPFGAGNCALRPSPGLPRAGQGAGRYAERRSAAESTPQFSAAESTPQFSAAERESSLTPRRKLCCEGQRRDRPLRGRRSPSAFGTGAPTPLRGVLRGVLRPGLFPSGRRPTATTLAEYLFPKKLCQRIKCSQTRIRFLRYGNTTMFYTHPRVITYGSRIDTFCKAKPPRVASLRLALGLFHPCGFGPELELSPKGVFAAQQRRRNVYPV
uniref:Uncharacterized protein n=1 Tax=Caulerpa lentillifera TaxID=148947 RepID=A0A2Z2QKB4_9CHLO|nr:hypothetical protein [Caulerpa lentillifera]AST24222.1 hypothetical protein [Caulerpa lentillifera]